jgi:hypothetical protein
MKRLYIIFILLLVIINIQCNSGGNAIVTINVGTTPKISYLDHFLQLLTFAKKANAAVPTNVASISYKVEASDIETITGAIPLETGSVTLELTPGNNRTFTVYAYDSNNFKIYAGKTTVDLQPGNNTVDIVMEKTMFTIDSSSNIADIDLAIGNGIPYIAYINSSQININIKYLSGITLQTIDTTSLTYPADSLDLEYYNTIYIASHFQNVNYYINVSKFNGSSWNPLLDNGDDILNVDNNANTFSLKINSVDEYIAYTTNSYYPAVKKYSEGATPTWDPVGSLSTPQGGGISMAYDSANNIYIAYTTTSDTIEVKKYSGSSWSNFPNTNTPPTYNPMEVSIAIDGNDVVYVAHRNNINPSRVAVVKCPQNGTEWTPAAGSDMYVSGTIKAAEDIQMAFDGNNRLYVVYYDFNSSDYSNYQLHIKRVNGSNWEEVDVINLPTGHYVFSPKIAIRGDVCYIAFNHNYSGQSDVILYKIML